jgi:hypothetical protein
MVIFAAFVLGMSCTVSLAEKADVEKLMSEARPDIQEQVKKTYEILLRTQGPDTKSNCEQNEEVGKLKNITKDKGEIVKQLAIFTAMTESEEDEHIFVAAAMLKLLEVPPSVPIRVLAPYIDSDNEKLRSFASGWFETHDTDLQARSVPTLAPVNYYDYMQYVRARLSRNEEIPSAFVKYIYERHPGKALLVFAYSNSVDISVARLQGLRKAIDKRLKNAPAHDGAPAILPPIEIPSQQSEPERPAKTEQQLEKENHARLMDRREIELAEHIVSNAIWLNTYGYTERFQSGLPEANEQLDKLAKGEWWAKLYVVYIMRQNPSLLKAQTLQKLSEDDNELVQEAAKSAGS